MDTGCIAEADEAPEKIVLLTEGTEGKRKHMAAEVLDNL